jgi:hypothetical protein
VLGAWLLGGRVTVVPAKLAQCCGWCNVGSDGACGGVTACPGALPVVCKAAEAHGMCHMQCGAWIHTPITDYMHTSLSTTTTSMA